MERMASSQPRNRRLKTYGRSSTQPSHDASSAVSTARAARNYMFGLGFPASEPASKHDTSSTERGKRSFNDGSDDHETPPSADKRRKTDAASSFLTQVPMSSPASSIFDVVDATQTLDPDDTALTVFSPVDAKGHASSEQETADTRAESHAEDLVALFMAAPGERRAPPAADIPWELASNSTRDGSGDSAQRENASALGTVVLTDGSKLAKASQDASQLNGSDEHRDGEKGGNSANDEAVDEHDAEETASGHGVFLSQPTSDRDHSPTLTASPSYSPQKASSCNSSPEACREEEPSQSLPLRHASDGRQHRRAAASREQRDNSPLAQAGPGANCLPVTEPGEHRESSPIVILHPQLDQDDSDAQSPASFADADEEAGPGAFSDAAGSGSEHLDDDASGGEEEDPSIIQASPSMMPVPLDNTVDKVEYSIQEIVGHRASKDVSDALDLEVRWVGYDETTWEPERSVQAQAPDAVYKYWRSVKGGRPGSVYRVFAILGHYANKSAAAAAVSKQKPPAGSTRNLVFRVQWEGYSASDEDTTIEPAGKIKRIAPAVVETYWEHVREAERH